MRWQRRGDFARDIKALRQHYGFFEEIKWQKAHSKKYAKFYEDLVDYFFRSSWLAFHCIVIRKSVVNKEYHGGDYDLARRKHFTKFISKKIQRVLEAHKGRDCEIRVEVDPIASRYKKADEAFHKIANNQLRQELKIAAPIRAVVTKDSKESEQIQISDFLLGAIMAAWQGKASSEGKTKMQEHVARYLGWTDLASDTKPIERKFNIWYFYDRSQGPREVKTRDVHLKYPLPARVRLG